MGCYKVRFDDYCLAHYDSCKYFDYFEFGGKKYHIGSYVDLTESGKNYFLRDADYSFVRGNFRLVDHYITDKGTEEWKYIIGRSHDGNMPYFRSTRKSPDELINNVLSTAIDETVYTPGELKVEFKEFNYSPKDSEVENVMLGWVVFFIVWIVAFVLKDWWLRLVVQLCAVWYFSSWRNKKINEAIITQKFKE